MREGKVFRRCGKCSRRLDGNKRTCAKCGSSSFTWAYRVDVALPGAKREERFRAGFASKDEAVTAMNDAQTNAGKPEPSKAALGGYLQDWLRSIHGTIKPSTWQSYREHVDWYITPRIGDTLLRDLTRTAVKGLYAELAVDGRRRGTGGLAPKTVHNVHITLRRALAVAVEDGLLAVNPAAAAHKAPAAAERQTWTEDDLRRFLRAVREDRLFGLWRLAGYSGARRGELLALRWPKLDLPGGLVTINLNRVKGEDGQVYEDTPKSPRSRRTIDIDPDTIRVLREHRKRQLDERMAWRGAYVEEDRVFCREDGAGLHPDTVSDFFGALCRKAEVPALGMHAALRHLHGSVMLRAGVPLHVVSRRLGHADDAFTSRVYAHILPQQGAEAAAAFAAAIEEPDETTDETEVSE